jgi:hypothetical protein
VNAITPNCNICKNINPQEKGKPRGCKAYPAGIPMWYASGDVPHTSLAGDEVDGIMFEPTVEIKAIEDNGPTP